MAHFSLRTTRDVHVSTKIKLFKIYKGAEAEEILKNQTKSRLFLYFIEPIPPNIRNDIVSESGMTRSSSRLEKKNNETSRIPPNKNKIDSWRFGRFMACVE